MYSLFRIITAYIKYGNTAFPCVQVASEFFFSFLHCFDFPFFFFLTTSKNSQSCLFSFFLPGSTRLPAGFLLHLLVLPHFFRVFVLPDKHRDIATLESLAFMNILALMREMPGEQGIGAATVHKDLNRGVIQSVEYQKLFSTSYNIHDY